MNEHPINATKKEDFLNHEINKLKESEEFKVLNSDLQNEILANMKEMAKKPTNDFKEWLSWDQKLIYSALALLVVFLFVNVFYTFVDIPVIYYTMFYAVSMAVAFLILMKKRKYRIDSLFNVIINWDEMTAQWRNDFL